MTVHDFVVRQNPQSLVLTSQDAVVDQIALDVDEDLMPPPTPAPGGSLQPKDGDIVRPSADGRPPDAPDGFTVVSKDNGQFVLRKRRYRDLKKVGIGGFQAKSRNTNKKTKEEPEGAVGPDGEKPKKRPSWRPKKNKILAQYPEYIQDSFFGREFLDSCTTAHAYELQVKPVDEDGNQSNDEDAFELGKEALNALSEIRKLKEKQKQDEEEKAAKLKMELDDTENGKIWQWLLERNP